jgi:hypothetical protein
MGGGDGQVGWIDMAGENSSAGEGDQARIMSLLDLPTARRG